MDVVRAQLSDRVITAPFDGVLGLRQVSPGSLVTPGTPIATLDDVSVIKLDFSVPERYLAVLSRGQDVAAHSETYPDRDFAGTVASVDSRVDPVTRSVTVRAEVPNPERLLRRNAAVVRLYQAPREAIVVPEIAVIQVAPRLSSTACRRTRRPSASRSRWDRAVAARSRSLRSCAGDTIVSEGAVKLRDGARVASAPASAPRRQRSSVVLSDLSIRRPVFATVMTCCSS